MVAYLARWCLSSAGHWQLFLDGPSLMVFAIANVIGYQLWELDAWIALALPFVSQYFTTLIFRLRSLPGRILGSLIVALFVFSCSCPH
jgi:hypothetical protein